MMEPDEMTFEYWGVYSHEAGHAVARWMRRLPAGALTANEDGNGECRGSDRGFKGSAALFVYLAGFAVESCYGLISVDLTLCHERDFDEARKLIERVLLPGMTVESALEAHFQAACRDLCPYGLLVQKIATRLKQEGGHLSARSVAAICREHAKRDLRRPDEAIA